MWFPTWLAMLHVSCHTLATKIINTRKILHFQVKTQKTKKSSEFHQTGTEMIPGMRWSFMLFAKKWNISWYKVDLHQKNRLQDVTKLDPCLSADWESIILGPCRSTNSEFILLGSGRARAQTSSESQNFGVMKKSFLQEGSLQNDRLDTRKTVSQRWCPNLGWKIAPMSIELTDSEQEAFLSRKTTKNSEHCWWNCPLNPNYSKSREGSTSHFPSIRITVRAEKALRVTSTRLSNSGILW